MAWIESHQDLATNPKTRKAARALGVTIPAMMGHLHSLWHWALDHAEDGDLTGYDVDDIAIAARWDGDADKFVNALIECSGRSGFGFIDRVATGLRLHDWAVYTGHLQARRESARKANHTRWHVSRGVRVDGCGWCAESPQQSGSNGSGVRPVSERTPNGVGSESTQHNTTEPDTTETPSSPPGDTDDGFEHFWATWPKRNGKKLAKDKAHRAWARLTLPERRDAYRGAVNYAAASYAGKAGAKDAFRWLQGREWPDWQTPIDEADGGVSGIRTAEGVVSF